MWCVMQILIGQNASDETDLAVLAMGRMAGNEMNFGSDLDLIFLYSGDSQENFAIMSRQVQSLLRQVASISAAGNLYEIDMRLRPHGTSGTLISSAQYFIEYHSQERQVWERQMMTRCRVIVDSNNLAEQAMDNITSAIYAEYDKEYLKNEIITMRRKVQEELGSPKGKHEIKRGVGGIMDIDFLSHYLQLLHGHKIKSIKTSSTRIALRNLAKENILDKSTCNELLDAYDFLKQLEGRLRVHDMKSVSSFSSIAGGVHVLARAMGYMEEDRNKAAEEFLDTYLKVTKTVRQHFKMIIGKI